MGINFHIQEFDAPDLDMVRNILCEVLTQTFSEYNVIDSINKLLEDESLTFLLPKAGERIFLAFADKKPAGVLVTRQLYGKIHIQGLYVLPMFQRCGLGKMFISHVDEQSSNGMIFEAEVMEANVNAVAFYSALGFVEVCRRHTQIKEGQTATILLMRLCTTGFRR